MPKGAGGGKRFSNIPSRKLERSGKPTELDYFVDSNGIKRYNGKDGWKLSFNTHTEVEKEDAAWLQEILGERVYLNPKAELPKKQKSSDYVTESGTRIEQKGPTSFGLDKIERLVNQGKYQASILLVNVTGLNLSKHEIERQVNNALYKNHSRHFVNEIIIIDGNELIERYKKRSIH